jgi:nucleoside-diphosphate-sugar epimerase
MIRALVTGAGGFIGQHLVRALIERRLSVVVLSRRRFVSDTCATATKPECIVGDIRDRDTLGRAMRDVDWVFHLAAATAPRTLAESRAVNVEGTRMVATVAASQPRPPVLVYVSSLAAVGPSETMLRESAACRPVSYYGRGKCEAEQVLETFAERLTTTVIRPPCVFGRGDRNLLRLSQLVRRGWELHAAPDWRYSFLHVDDLIGGLIAAAAQGQRLQRTPNADRVGVYFLADTQPLTFPELAERIAACLGVSRLHHVRVPRAVAWLSAVLSETTQNVTGHKTYFNRDKLREAYGGSWVCDPARAQRELTFAPACCLTERLAQTHREFAADGWV